MNTYKTQKRRDKARYIKDKDRELLRLQKEQRELRDILFKAPLIKLEKPYQRGWIRYFVLKEEALRRKDAERLEILLEKVQCKQYSKNRGFLERRHDKGRRLQEMRHELSKFSASTAMGLPETVLPYLVTHKKYPVGNKTRLRELYLSSFGGPLTARYPHYFKRIVEPYMITHSRVALPDVERRLNEIEYIIYQPSNFGRLAKLQRSHPDSWRLFHESLRRCKLKQSSQSDIQEAMNEYFVEPQPAIEERMLPPPSCLLSFILLLKQLSHTSLRSQNLQRWSASYAPTE